jgi:PAS domain S-box-containing protein
MNKFNSTLFIFLIPAFIVSLLAAAINLGTLYVFNRDQQSMLSQINHELAVDTEADSLVVDIGKLHQQVVTILEKAVAGNTSEEDIYSIHTRIVNDLATIKNRIRNLIQNANDLGLGNDQLDLLIRDFQSYGNIITIATDISSTDPHTAAQYIEKAQVHYLSFAQNANIVSSLISDRVRSRVADSQVASRNTLLNIALISLGGLLGLIGLSYLSTVRVSQRISTVIDALKTLGNKTGELPSIPQLVEMQFKESGDIKAMADAVLGFRKLLLEQKRSETELRIAAIAFETQEGLMITDADMAILRVNKAFTEITGYAAKEVVGQTPRLLKSDRHDSAFFRAMWDSVHRTGKWQGEIWNRHKDGETYPNWLTISAVKRGDGLVTHYVGSYIDQRERKAAVQES